MTIVPWFRLGEPSEQIGAGLSRAFVAIKPFEAQVGDMAMFGPKKNRQARLLQAVAPFSSLEQKVRSYLHKKQAWLVDETTKRRQEFRPHVTLQKTSELAEGERFQVARLYIVEQKGDYKEVMVEIPLV